MLGLACGPTGMWAVVHMPVENR